MTTGSTQASDDDLWAVLVVASYEHRNRWRVRLAHCLMMAAAQVDRMEQRMLHERTLQLLECMMAFQESEEW
jgi:hypothetical protein